MSDIAIIGERTYLYEKLFADLGVSFQFLSPGILGSPFLPQFKAVMIPTGFANPEYSKTLAALQRMKSNISGFVKRGGVLTVFGPMMPEHDYDWLPLPLCYVCELGSRSAASSEHECSCLLNTPTPECDGYLIAGPGFETVLKDEKDRAILVRASYGEGLIVATSVHEFPAAEYIKWALGRGGLPSFEEMMVLQEAMTMNEEMPAKKKSKLREDIESLLREKGITLEERITVMSLDTGDAYYFNDYPEALQFLKEKKGRWYLTTPGIRRNQI